MVLQRGFPWIPGFPLDYIIRPAGMPDARDAGMDAGGTRCDQAISDEAMKPRKRSDARQGYFVILGVGPIPDFPGFI